MANQQNCGCGRSRGCLASVRSARWDNYPYYGGGCPDVNGVYEDDCCGGEQVELRAAQARGCCCGRRRRCGDVYGIFTAGVPMAVAANGIIPLAESSGCGRDFCVNNGVITLEDPGVYLAIYTALAPEGTTVNSTITLNVNEISQPSAITVIGANTGSVTGQAIFSVSEGATVSLRTSEELSSTTPSLQPAFTLTLTQIRPAGPAANC